MVVLGVPKIPKQRAKKDNRNLEMPSATAMTTEDRGAVVMLRGLQSSESPEYSPGRQRNIFVTLGKIHPAGIEPAKRGHR